ncbi:MAG: hypothetical protein ACHBNF_08330 [Chromatiales bacterium]
MAGSRRPWSLLGAVLGRANEMGEDLGNASSARQAGPWAWLPRGTFDGGDDLRGAAALGAVFHIDLEHSFEQPRDREGRAKERAIEEAYRKRNRSISTKEAAF